MLTKSESALLTGQLSFLNSQCIGRLLSCPMRPLAKHAHGDGRTRISPDLMDALEFAGELLDCFPEKQVEFSAGKKPILLYYTDTMYEDGVPAAMGSS